MGYTSGWSTKAKLIAYLVRDDSASKCLRSCFRGEKFSGVLWSVREFVKDQKVIICCDVLSCHDQQLYPYKKVWGYRDLCESMHPYYYSCPLSYLKLAKEVACQDWRTLVMQYHKERSEKRQAIVPR